MTYITTTSEIGEPRLGEAGRQAGREYATVIFGSGIITFTSPAEARSLAAACATAAGAMENLAAPPAVQPDTEEELAEQAALPWVTEHQFDESASVPRRCHLCGRYQGDAVHEVTS